MLERHFSWQVQYLVMLEGASCCSTHCTGRFMRDEDQWRDSRFSLQAQCFVKLEGVSWCSAHCTGRFMCESQFSWQARYLVRDFWCSARCTGRFTCDEDRSCESFFCGRSSVRWRWRVTPVAPRNVNDVSCVESINHECRSCILLFIP